MDTELILNDHEIKLFDNYYYIHFRHTYYEKPPVELSYREMYCSNGYIIFKPYHHYILNIKENCYNVNKNSKLDVYVQFLNKLRSSGAFLYTIDDLMGL